MPSFKQIIKCIIFVALCVMINYAINFAIMPSSYSRAILHELNHSDKKFDTIILGASHARTDINPYTIDKYLNLNSINLSIPGENIDDSYYLLRECARKNNPKVVIIDLDYQYWYDLKRSDFSAPFICAQLPFSPLKLQYMADQLLQKDFRVTLSRWAKYTYMTTQIKQNLKNKLSPYYKNYSMDAVNNIDAGGPYLGKGFFDRKNLGYDKKGSVQKCKLKWGTDKINVAAVKYFKKIAQYCKEKNIKLVAVTSPTTPATLLTGSGVYTDINRFFKEMCSSLDVQYLDFNFVRSDVLKRENTGFVDYDGHMTGEYADKYTTVLANIIGDCLNNRLDENKYFYSSYKEYLDNLDKINMVDMDLIPSIKENGNFGLELKVMSGGGTYIKPIQKVEISDSETGEKVLETQYSGRKKYAFELKRGTYTVTVFAKNKNSNSEFDVYCKKTIELNEKTVKKMQKESHN